MCSINSSTVKYVNCCDVIIWISYCIYYVKYCKYIEEKTETIFVKNNIQECTKSRNNKNE